MAYSGWADTATDQHGYEFGAYRGHYQGPKNHYVLASLNGQVEKYRHVEWQEYQEIPLDYGMEAEERVKMLGEPVEQDTYVYPESATYIIEFLPWEQLRSLELTGHVAAWAKAGDGYICEYWRL